METNSEIRRLVDIMPASGRMSTRILSKPSQSVVIASSFPLPWQRQRLIEINFDLWRRLTPAQRDLVLLRTVSWLGAIRWFEFGPWQGLGALGTGGALGQLLQGDVVGGTVALGLLGAASWQIWQQNHRPSLDIDADQEAVRVAQRRGYQQAEAIRHLLEALEKIPELEGRSGLNFSELLRLQNLRSLAKTPQTTP